MSINTIINISGDYPSAIVLEYKKNGINYSQNLNSFQPNEFDVAIKSAKWMNGLYNKKLQNNLWLSESLKISNLNLWWHWVTWAQETNSIINSKVFFLLFERLLTFCKLIQPTLIRYDGKNLWVQEIISEVCKQRNIEFISSGRLKNNNLKYWQVLFKLIRFFIRKMLWDFNILRFFKKKSQNNPEQKKRIIFCSGDTWSLKQRPNNHFEYQDVHYGKIISALKGKHSINFIQIIPKYRFLLKGILKKIFKEVAIYEPYESYFRWRDFFPIFIQYLLLRRRWKLIASDLRNDFDFSPKKNISNWWVKKSISFYLSLPILEHLLCFYTSRNAIKKIKPDYILLSGEWGPYSLSLVMEANNIGIPVDALQHGFTSKAVSTNHLSSAVNLRNGDGPSPVANFFLLYGVFYKNLLANYSKIPEMRCKVLGSPRFDDFKKSEFLRKNIRKKLVGNGDKNLILISVANVQSGYKYETLKKIFSSLKEIDDICLVVKLHPEEAEKIEEYKAVANSLKMTVIFKTGYGLWDLLIASDLFITEFSTAVLESAIAEVETLLIDFYSIGYAKYYNNHPFLVEINDEQSLIRYVKTKINDSKKKIANKDFIKSHLHKCDGLSANRLIKFINKRLSRKNINAMSSL